MTIKQFFQGKVFKCILVLLCIALISGGLLAILNDLWSVSDDEITQRAIKAVCGNDVKLDKTLEVKNANFDHGKINKVHKLNTGDYLIEAQGNEGFHSGWVSVYVLADFENNEFVGIKNVSIAEYASSQTLMSKFNDQVLSKFKGLKTPSDAKPNEIASGATYSSNAVKNAVNTAIEYINSELKEG